MRLARTPMNRILVLTILGTVSLATVTLSYGQLSNEQVQESIGKLGDNDPQVRGTHHKRLKDNLGRLMPEQIDLINAAKRHEDAEVRKRAKSLIEDWSGSVPAISNALTPIALHQSVFDPNTNLTTFQFGVYAGSVDVDGQGVLRDLEKAWKAVHDAFRGADIAKIPTSVQAMKDLFSNMTDADFARLSLTNPVGNPNRQAIVDLVNNSLQQVNVGITALKNGMNNQNPAPPQNAPVNQGGMVDGQKSLIIDVDSVITPGELAFMTPSGSDVVYLPPTGYRFVGEIHDVRAVDALEVSGLVEVTVEFGIAQFIGPPVTVVDLSTLRLARMANGQAELLNSTVDTANNKVTAQYTPSSAASGQDQFGEFAVVEPVPPIPAISGWRLPLLALLICTGVGVLKRRLGPYQN